MQKTIIKRLVTAVLAAAVIFSTAAVPAQAMTKKQVNREISKLKKSIDTNNKEYPKALKNDNAKMAQYTYIKGSVICYDPILIYDQNQKLYMHFTSTEGLYFSTMNSVSFVEGLVKVSDKQFVYGLWTCYDSQVVEQPHSALDIQTKITNDKARLKLLQNSKKELVAIDGVTLAKGESVQLVTHFSYNTQEINTLKWKSSNAKVVSVSKSGVVTGKKKGSAVISAKLSVTGKTYKTVVNVQ